MDFQVEFDLNWQCQALSLVRFCSKLAAGRISKGQRTNTPKCEFRLENTSSVSSYILGLENMDSNGQDSPRLTV